MGRHLSLPGSGQSHARFNHFSPLINDDEGEGEEAQGKETLFFVLSVSADDERASRGGAGFKRRTRKLKKTAAVALFSSVRRIRNIVMSGVAAVTEAGLDIQLTLIN